MNFDIGHRPKISIAIPAYNAASTIKLCIDSLLNQTISDIEIVVCNDASTDETLQILNSFDDQRIEIISNLENLGEGKTRDRAIECCSGEWIAVLDADDCMDEKRLENMLMATKGESNVMVFDDLLVCHHTPNGLVPWRRMRGRKAFNGNGSESIDVNPVLWALSYQFLIKPLLHADTLRALNIKHTTLKFGADTEFFLKLIANGIKLRYLPEAYYRYRIMPNSASANKKRMELMNGMLESIGCIFSDNIEMQNAIKHRIQYRLLLQNLKKFHLYNVVSIIFRDPRALVELIHRSIRQFFYLIHRSLSSGSSR